MDTVVVTIILLSPIFVGILGWFILSKNGWCPLFARVLKWGSILSLACYVTGFLIDWLDATRGNTLGFVEVTAILVLAGLLLSILVCASALIGGPIIWLQSRRRQQVMGATQVPQPSRCGTPSEELITLLVVIIVAFVLLAIAVPSFIKNRNTAAQNACINNLRMIDSGKEQVALAYRWENAVTNELIPTNHSSIHGERGGRLDLR